MASAVAGADEVVVTLVNRGADTWTANTRLAAASGCPDATATNQLAWAPVDGYVNDVLDARVFLPHDVAPGESIELRIPFTAPAEPGTYVFAARMVEEGVAFFGQTVRISIEIGSTSSSGLLK